MLVANATRLKFFYLVSKRIFWSCNAVVTNVHPLATKQILNIPAPPKFMEDLSIWVLSFPEL